VTYEFACTNSDGTCGAVTETYQYNSTNCPESIPCPYCGGVSLFKISAPAVLTQNMGNKPFDVAVGRDAEMRWNEIHRQQEIRDKVRQETKQTGLAITGFNEFRPVSEENKKLRQAGMKAVEREGFKAEPV
jgi:hypothetical protein